MDIGNWAYVEQMAAELGLKYHIQGSHHGPCISYDWCKMPCIWLGVHFDRAMPDMRPTRDLLYLMSGPGWLVLTNDRPIVAALYLE